MSSGVTHIWFRSGLSLSDIAEKMGMSDATKDCENYWAWIIGDVAGVRLDITRTDCRPRRGVDTCIFRLDRGEFSDQLMSDVVGRLSAFIRGTIRCGRWESQRGNSFKLITVREFDRPAKSAQ